ncbi:MAG TPA: SCO family protein [Methylomirabilota bacterium]|nr:SCO family protein [Methylomirabilota bacterium]
MIRTARLLTATMVALAAVAGAAWAHGSGSTAADLGFPRFDYEPPRPGTYALPAIKPAADAHVVDAAGAPRRLHGLMGDRIVVVSFISTRCVDPQGCPLATAVLHQIRAAAGRDPVLARRLRLVTVSFDLRNDSPAALGRYAGAARQESRGTSPWDFVVPTSERELTSLLEAYGQPVGLGDRTAPPTHLLRVYLIDAGRRIRNVYGLDFLDARLLLADVRTLLLEEQGHRP